MSDAFGDSVYEHGEAIEDADDLDPVENLTGDDPDEQMQTGYSPPEREPHDLRDAPTPREEREGEPLDRKLRREDPEPEGALTEPDPRARRLVAPDEGWRQDVNNDEFASDVGPAGYASSAEEAAVHVVDEDHPAE